MSIKKSMILKWIVCLFLAANPLCAETFILDSLTEANKLSAETHRPILLIFGSDSCSFCSLLKSSLESDLKKDIDNYIVCYLNIKTNPSLKEEHNISLIPESRIILDNKIISIQKGFNSQTYRIWLQKNAQ